MVEFKSEDNLSGGSAVGADYSRKPGETNVRIGQGFDVHALVAGRKLKDCGMATSITVILGLGGVEGSERHAIKTAEVLNRMDPDFAGSLTLVLTPGTPLYQDWQEGRFTPISAWQSLRELTLMIEHSSFTDCFFTSNHASNYLPLRVRLPQQKAAAIKLIDEVLTRKDIDRLRPDFMRAL